MATTRRKSTTRRKTSARRRRSASSSSVPKGTYVRLSGSGRRRRSSSRGNKMQTVVNTLMYTAVGFAGGRIVANLLRNALPSLPSGIVPIAAGALAVNFTGNIGLGAGIMAAGAASFMPNIPLLADDDTPIIMNDDDYMNDLSDDMTLADGSVITDANGISYMLNDDQFLPIEDNGNAYDNTNNVYSY